jgi:hypothetical protein
MKAYHNDPSIKAAILAQLAHHRAADEIVKGRYWENGKGCAIGCTLHSSDHAEYEIRFGIPQMLAQLEDCIFEGLPNDEAKQWPERFMSAIKPGVDLSIVGWKFLHWILTDKTINPGIDHPLVKDAIERCASIMLSLSRVDKIDKASAAASAARSAWSAARSAESAARSAARSAESAAWSAESAAWSAERSAERSAAYVRMSDKLIALIKKAPKSEDRKRPRSA